MSESRQWNLARLENLRGKQRHKITAFTIPWDGQGVCKICSPLFSTKKKGHDT